jgi:hypothetical protein
VIITTDSLVSLTKEISMKTLITALVLASLVGTSAFAKTAVHTRHVDQSYTFESGSLGHQSFANPDREFSIENLGSHAS